MPDHLNFFEPYENIPAHHENQLTRALLVVLRYSPMAHQAWLSLVDQELHLHQLPQPGFRTQQARILEKGISGPANEAIKGISVICAADASKVEGKTVKSDRVQVLDGIVRYGDDLVIVLETKLDGPAPDRQAREINLHGQPVAFEGKVRTLSWRSVLDSFADLADDDRGVTAGSERKVLQDFLNFTDRNFPNLGPFSTLDRCGGEQSRVMRRLRKVMKRLRYGGAPNRNTSPARRSTTRSSPLGSTITSETSSASSPRSASSTAAR